MNKLRNDKVETDGATATQSTHADSKAIVAAAFSPSTGEVIKVVKRRKPAFYLLATLLFSAVVVLWYLVSAKSVVITTEPTSHEIIITGGLYFKMSDHLLMLPGEYQFKSQAVGYYPLNEKFIVAQEQNQQLNFDFKKLPGHLALAIQPDIDVEVLLDDQPVQLQDNIIKNLAAGQHQISVLSEKYFTYHDDIIIDGMDKTQNLTINLLPAWGKVSINSEPIGAQVYHNDKLLGSTPLYVDILQGEQNFLFKKTGYQQTERELSVVAGADNSLALAKLFKLMGKLSISSTPEGISVTYGEQYLGVTPITAQVKPNIKQALLLFKDGYQSQLVDLLVPSGAKVAKNFTLQLDVGVIKFNVSPEDALLYIDDRLMGHANKSVTMVVKQQKIRIEKEGYASYQSNVLPNSSMEQIFAVQLKTIEQAKWENIKPIIVSATGSKLKLFKPNDTFIMGASRREQGRRANEVKRTIHLSKAFYLGFTEVTNKEFRQFQKDHSSGHVKGNSLNGLAQPAVKMTWLQAVKYCNWLSEQEKLTMVYQIVDDKVTSFNELANGYRLPTEAEWAWVARYSDGQMLKYSWGKNLPPVKNAGNIADIAGAPILGHIQATYNDSFIATAPVASFSKNEKGIFDLSGNAAEWVHDFYQIKTGLSLAAEKDPMGPITGDYHVIRGPSWAYGSRTQLRLSFRDYGNDKRNDLGFRVARYAQ